MTAKGDGKDSKGLRLGDRSGAARPAKFRDVEHKAEVQAQFRAFYKAGEPYFEKARDLARAQLAFQKQVATQAKRKEFRPRNMNRYHSSREHLRGCLSEVLSLDKLVDRHHELGELIDSNLELLASPSDQTELQIQAAKVSRWINLFWLTGSDCFEEWALYAGHAAATDRPKWKSWEHAWDDNPYQWPKPWTGHARLPTSMIAKARCVEKTTVRKKRYRSSKKAKAQQS